MWCNNQTVRKPGINVKYALLSDRSQITALLSLRYHLTWYYYSQIIRQSEKCWNMMSCRKMCESQQVIKAASWTHLRSCERWQPVFPVLPLNDDGWKRVLTQSSFPRSLFHDTHEALPPHNYVRSISICTTWHCTIRMNLGLIGVAQSASVRPGMSAQSCTQTQLCSRQGQAWDRD